MKIKLREQLKVIMAKHQLKVVSLAKATGIPGQTIHGWLQGKAPRNFDQVKKVSSHLGVSLDWLLYAEEIKDQTGLVPLDEIQAGVWEVILRKPK